MSDEAWQSPLKMPAKDEVAFDYIKSPEHSARTIQGMMGMGAGVSSLKSVAPGSRVKEIRYCGDTYTITTADRKSTVFWERNLRFKTEMSEEWHSV